MVSFFCWNLTSFVCIHTKDVTFESHWCIEILTPSNNPEKMFLLKYSDDWRSFINLASFIYLCTLTIWTVSRLTGIRKVIWQCILKYCFGTFLCNVKSNTMEVSYSVQFRTQTDVIHITSNFIIIITTPTSSSPSSSYVRFAATRL